MMASFNFEEAAILMMFILEEAETTVCVCVCVCAKQCTSVHLLVASFNLGKDTNINQVNALLIVMQRH